MIAPDLARNITRLAKHKDISLRALSKQIDVPYRSLQNYISGKSGFPADVVFKIATALEVETDLLFTGRISISTDDLHHAVGAALQAVLPFLRSDGRTLRFEPEVQQELAPELIAALKETAVSHVTSAIKSTYQLRRRISGGGMSDVIDEVNAAAGDVIRARVGQ